MLLQPPAEFNLHGVLLIGAQPYLAAGQPVIGQLGLGAVHQLLLKDAVLVQDGVAGAVVTIGGHAIQVAGSQAAQAAIAETWVRLAGKEPLRCGAEGDQRLGKGLHQPQVIQAVFQALAHQEFHRKIVDALFAFGGGLGAVGTAFFHHQVAQHQGRGLIQLVIAGQLGLYLHQVLQFIFHRQTDLFSSHIGISPLV